MLTVKQINEVSFGKAGFSGYKPEDVDNFIDEVASSFQQLLDERDEAVTRNQELAAQNSELAAKNAELQEKLAVLAEKIETYRENEDGIKDALLSAQKTARASLQEAKDKAALILQDARESAQQLLNSAKDEASKAAGEYMAQADAKKDELEEIKRQVSAFRGSLLEMYKKHLEQINHIPNFRQKEQPAEEAPAPVEPAPVSAPQPEPQPEPEPESEPEPVQPAPAVVPEPVPAPAPVAAPAPVREQPRPTLHDKVDFSKDQGPVDEDDDLMDDDLSEVGIDLKTYSSIPESLRREKSSHFSNLEFGDDVDLGGKKRKK